MGQNVNENKAMTKVVIAMNGVECERKQGNDEGRHCKNRYFNTYRLSQPSECPVACTTKEIETIEIHVGWKPKGNNKSTFV